MTGPSIPRFSVFLLALLSLVATLPVSRAEPPPRREVAKLTFAPEVPPPITRRQPATVVVNLTAESELSLLGTDPQTHGEIHFRFWSFNEHVPGPFIRVRVGDTLEVHLKNNDAVAMPHNIDLHAVTGPGGGATVTNVNPHEEQTAFFKMMRAGLYIYHCAAPPVYDHIANGMYGLILVEPPNGLPRVDREFYVLQSEIYSKPPTRQGDKDVADYSRELGLAEQPSYVVFNGQLGALTEEGTLHVKTSDRVRFYFGNAGPNRISSFHVIGTIFDKVYREGSLEDPPAHGIQTTLVPAGGAVVVELVPQVPGTFTLVDHAIFRVGKGAVGFLEAAGPDRPEIFRSVKPAKACPGCEIHP
jgi:copper-containing nitrite reductase